MSQSCRFLWPRALALTLLWTAQAKLTKVLQVGGPRDEDRWVYFTKFASDIGETTAIVRGRLLTGGESVTVDIDQFLDTEWREDVGRMPSCERKESGLSHGTRILELPVAGDWSDPVSFSMSQRRVQHFWIYSVSACDNENFGTQVLELELEAQQPDHGPLSYELHTMPAISFFSLALAGAVLCFWLLAITWRVCAKGAISLKASHLAPGLVVAVQLAAHAFHNEHWRAADLDGVGHPVTLEFAEDLLLMNRVLLGGLILAIARGNPNMGSRANRLHLVKPLGHVLALATVYALLLKAAQASPDSPDKLHEVDGIWGDAVFVMSLALCAWFVLAVRELQKTGGSRLRRARWRPHLRAFKLLGAVHFLGLPIVVVVAKFVATYWRYPVVHGVRVLVHMTTCVLLIMLLHFGLSKAWDPPGAEGEDGI